VKCIAFTGVVAGSVLLLAGCASGDQISPWGEYYQVLRQSFSGSFGSKAVTRDRAAAVPYASLGYRLNGGPESMIVLATDNGGEELWTSSAHIVIVTQDGSVKRTVGLPHDLGQWTPARGSSLLPPVAALTSPQTVTLLADFPDRGSYSSAVTCHLAAAGPETVTILGRAIATTRVNEDCDAPQLKWQFRNSYWLDGDHFVWRSVQHIHPSGDTLDIEIFRPPS
jgi:hypothetical protein